MTSTFLQAAQSYFGLADAAVRKTEVYSDNGSMVCVFEIDLSGDDMAGIVERMKAMAEVPDDIGQPVPQAQPSDEELRAEYNGLSARDKSRFGSFGSYKGLRQAGMEVQPTSDAADFGGFPG